MKENEMKIEKVLIRLNELKKDGIIQDYAIGGGYAYMLHNASMPTYDLDVIVCLPEDDYHKLYDYFRAENAKIEDVYIVIENMRVQFLPSYIGLLWNNAVKYASKVELKGVPVKLVNVEYLILFFLKSFRKKDRIRIQNLLDKANKDKILSLMEKFDNEQKLLFGRYEKILAKTQESKKMSS